MNAFIYESETYRSRAGVRELPVLRYVENMGWVSNSDYIYGCGSLAKIMNMGQNL